MRAAAYALIVALLPAAGTRSEEGTHSCLPAELRMRARFADPEQLVRALNEVDSERKRSAKRDAVARRFREAGCAAVEEQHGAGISEPNVVCRIAGKHERTIAIGSSPAFDGWASAALLPEIARAISSSERIHSYEIAMLSRSARESPSGARLLRDSRSRESWALFIHAGSLGFEKPLVSEESDDLQSCAIRELAKTFGMQVPRERGWDRLSIPCDFVRGNAPTPISNCSGSSVTRMLDVHPFIRDEIPVLGLYAFPERDAMNFRKPRATRLDAEQYVHAFRLLAAYAVIADQLLPLPGVP